MAKETLEGLKFDEHNFNKHTDKGMALLEKSIEENKFGRSILLDKDNNIIAGNGVVETAKKLGHKKVRIIETDGSELIAVRRSDLSIDSKEGRSLALADNAVAAQDLQWDDDELEHAQEAWGIQPTDWGVMPEVAVVFDEDGEGISESTYDQPEKERLECPHCHHIDSKNHFKKVQ